MHRTIVQQNLCIDERKERQRVFTEGVQAKKKKSSPRLFLQQLHEPFEVISIGFLVGANLDAKDKLAMRNKQPAVTVQKTEG